MSRHRDRDDADRAWQQLILTRARGRCERCGRRDVGLDAAHVIGRGRHRTRCNPDNGRALCHECHRTEHDVVGSRTFWENMIGETEYDRLYQLATDPLWKRPPDWWNDCRRLCRQQLEELY